ncbi:phosphoesterase [Bacillus pseudomycoides]|uniref:Phosphoesterase n=1 Tax=Bacillus pseudomycoides TaxID=64104 RepID=A0AA91ZTM0_9BACI|nr:MULTISPECIES: metallophosphoesterase [Bacillus]PEB51818.1 phosphoesterase [Bacillus sp. AFS098217]PED82467.1 phosphoesterase [Bacillus pseudomycoides]PEU06485.1 phosphoesterase [Bacillus sp. AFS019443]PEU16677.1 phosphoesterase [Bacillus sp. AFS014408]PFW64004.1 phosphoesterase [Bacillus sp. AFS075034]
MKKRYKKLLIISALAIGVSAFSYVQNNLISVSKISITSSKIPSNFKGFKIVQLSDLHSKKFGENQEILIEKVKSLNPEIIVITGDLVDSKRYDAAASLRGMKELVKHYPVYFVTGNHESWSGRYDSLEKELKRQNVIVLRNEHVRIQKDGQEIYLLGIDDPAFTAKNNDENEEITTVKNEVVKAKDTIGSDGYKLLLSHRPELLQVYAEQQIDLVLSGHAHGGQVRLPFIGGLVAPNQGVLPKYTAGLYEEQNTSMIVSRGLGNSVIPQRVFNRPEIVVVQLN